MSFSELMIVLGIALLCVGIVLRRRRAHLAEGSTQTPTPAFEIRFADCIVRGSSEETTRTVPVTLVGETPPLHEAQNDDHLVVDAIVEHLDEESQSQTATEHDRPFAAADAPAEAEDTGDSFRVARTEELPVAPEPVEPPEEVRRPIATPVVSVADISVESDVQPERGVREPNHTLAEAWRVPALASDEEEEEVMFGSEPLSPEQLARARARWEQQGRLNGRVAQAPIRATPCVTDVHREPLSSDTPSESSPAVAAANEARALPDLDDIDVMQYYDQNPRDRVALTRALAGNGHVSDPRAIDIFVRAVQDGESSELAWIGMSGFTKLMNQEGDVRESDHMQAALEAALQYESPLAAKAAQLLLGDVPHEQYAEFLRASVGDDKAKQVLTLLDPVLSP